MYVVSFSLKWRKRQKKKKEATKKYLWNIPCECGSVYVQRMQTDDFIREFRTMIVFVLSRSKRIYQLYYGR